MSTHGCLLLLKEAIKRIAEQMGLDFPQSRMGDLERAFLIAAKELGFSSTCDCIRWFNDESEIKTKIGAMAKYLTVGETYFMREPQSYGFLEEFIRSNSLGLEADGKRHLKIWCAGCSTGEEPYSVAIMIHRMGLLEKEWHVRILGTDINSVALDSARRGVYTEWSFRSSPKWLRETYFTATGDGKYRVNDEIQGMVSFRYLNLATDNYPDFLNETEHQTVIFCRNVMMYFTADQKAAALRKLGQCLITEGWMVPGACEIQGPAPEDFVAVNHRDYVLYKKNTVINSAMKAAPLLKPKSGVAADTFHASGDINRKPVDLVVSVPISAEIKACRLVADHGHLEEALGMIEGIILKDRMDPVSHFLHAAILMGKEKPAEAAMALRRTLYLDSSQVVAHLMLGNIALQNQRVAEALQFFNNALTLLEMIIPGTVISNMEGFTSEELARMIQSIISRINGDDIGGMLHESG